MKLKPGDKAPDFTAQVWNGPDLKLSDLRGQKVWLAFFRYAACPLCNLRVRDIIRRHDELTSNGVKVVAVFQSPKESFDEYVGKQNPPFPLVSDPKELLYKKYGLEAKLGAFLSPKNLGYLPEAAKAGFVGMKADGTKTRIPADFLIGPDGTVQDVFYGEIIADHIPFERVEKWMTRPA